jgi:hypothetical protein
MNNIIEFLVVLNSYFYTQILLDNTTIPFLEISEYGLRTTLF